MFASHLLWTFTIKRIQINFVFSKHKRNRKKKNAFSGFSVFILLYFSRNFLKWFYRHFIIFYFSFHLLESKKKKKFQFVVYKCFPFFQNVVIYFVIFSLAFLIASISIFCCQKHSITERNFFRSNHSLAYYGWFSMIKKSEGKTFRGKSKFFLCNNKTNFKLSHANI